MTLKIAGGCYKGLRLETPSSSITRPTSEMLRTAVFNICQNKIEDAIFLDLYAGSGAIGIEAMSRGAKEVVFVEKDKRALTCLKQNLANTSIGDQGKVLPFDVLSALKKLSPYHFDLVYIDPPYGNTQETLAAEKDLEKIFHHLETSSLLNDDAWVLLEFSSYSKKDFASLPLKTLQFENTRTFGRSCLHLFKGSCKKTNIH
jgi:16S rRNA (guanine(966)-N(2))-methyltransferase RsmD